MKKSKLFNYKIQLNKVFKIYLNKVLKFNSIKFKNLIQYFNKN